MSRLHYRPTLHRALWLGLGLFLLAASACSAQSPAYKAWQVFTTVEKQPEFPGGFGALRRYLLKTVNYPPEAKKAGVKDRVLVSFIVEPDSSISDVQLLKGIGYGCDEEAVRVITAMPRWKPGSQSGKTVRVKYNLPVLFGIDYPQDYPRYGRH